MHKRKAEEMFSGTWRLVRLALRRDRVRLPVWIGSIVGSLLLIAASFPSVYETAADRQVRAALMENPAAKAFAGPGYGLEDYTLGAMMTNEMMGFVAIFVALMGILLFMRHTRAEEESGSAELVRSNVVGRFAPLAAAFLVVGGAMVVIGVVTALGLGSLGIESIDWAGSWLYGAALGALGLAFVGVAAVTSQLSEHARTASGVAGVVIAVAYTLRAAGDMGDNFLTWLSPFGWMQGTMVYVDDRWWPLILLAAVFVLGGVVAFVLNSQRDLDAGVIPSRGGRADAAPGLLSAHGLAQRLQRTSFMWWVIGLFLFGLLYGSLVGEIEQFIGEVAFADALFGGADVLLDGFFAMIVSMFAMVCSIFAILAATRLRHEEVGGRAEPVLATAVSRIHWVMSHGMIALLGSTALMLVGTLGLALSAAVALQDTAVIMKFVGAAAVSIPAIWLFAAATLALFGVVPRAIGVVWLLLAYGFIVGILGPLLNVPDWAYNLSPFNYLPAVPAEEMAYTPLVVLGLLIVGLVMIGLLGFRRRDIASFG